MMNWLSSLGLGLWLRAILGVRLGRLYQHSPRPLSVGSAPSGFHVNDNPGICIVTPSYNQARFVAQTILSILNQDCRSLEYVVQDALSTDGTVPLLQSFNDPRLSVHIEADAGQADALNRGFKRTGQEIMSYLNSDDLLLPGTLLFVANYFREHPEVDVIYGNRLVVDENGLEVGRWILPYHDGELIKQIDYIPQETLFWRRRVWDATGAQFDASLKFAMDWDLILRLAGSGACFRHVPELFGVFRAHASQKTQADFRSRGSYEMALVRNRHSTGTSSRIRNIGRHLSFLLAHRRVDADFEKNHSPISS